MAHSRQEQYNELIKKYIAFECEHNKKTSTDLFKDKEWTIENLDKMEGINADKILGTLKAGEMLIDSYHREDDVQRKSDFYDRWKTSLARQKSLIALVLSQYTDFIPAMAQWAGKPSNYLPGGMNELAVPLHSPSMQVSHLKVEQASAIHSTTISTPVPAMISSELSQLKPNNIKKPSLCIRDQYDPKLAGKAVIYGTIFAETRALICCKRKPLANTRAAWNGKGHLFANTLAFFNGSRPIFANTRNALGCLNLEKIRKR